MEEARSKLRDENTRIIVRAERAERALQAYKEARAEAEITYLKRSEKGAWGGYVRHGSASDMVRKAEARKSQLTLSLEGGA